MTQTENQLAHYQIENGEERSAAVGTKDRAIVVLGMHRSGTSLCMNILSRLGVQLDNDLLAPNEHNPRGFFESGELMRLNEQIIRSLGITWHSVFPVRLKENWVDSAALHPAKQKLTSIMQERKRQGVSLWGFKDPRLCLLLPLYEQVLLACRIEPSYVLCIRNPGSVSLSLERRNNFPPILSELLWMDHTLRAIKGAGDRLKAVVEYETWFENPLREVSRLSKVLALSDSDQSPLSEADLQDVIVSDLDHARSRPYTFALSCTKSIYQLVRDGNYEDAANQLSEVERGLQMGACPSVALCQLFWRTTEQDYYTEVNSCCVYTDILSHRRVVRLYIPANSKPLTGLRLDPSDLLGHAHFLAMRLLDWHNRELWHWDGNPATIMAWDKANISLSPHLEERGVIAQFLSQEASLLLPVEDSALEQIAGRGGVLEFEFAWLKASSFTVPVPLSRDHIRSCSKTEIAERPGAVCQLFWRTAEVNYFTEANSCRVYIDLLPSRKVVRLGIPAAVGDITGLRFDPANISGLLHLLSLRLLNSDGSTLWQWNGEPGTILQWERLNLTLLSQAGRQGVFAYFESNDPVLLLPIAAQELDCISGAGGIVEVEFTWLGTARLSAELLLSDGTDSI